MRISIRRDDEGFREDAARVTVFFNGVPQSKTTGREVISADEELGEIRYYAHAPDGTPVPHPFKVQSIWEKVETGCVEIRDGGNI